MDGLYGLVFKLRWVINDSCGDMEFRIEIFENDGGGEKGDFGAQCPELALLTAHCSQLFLYKN